MKNLYFFLKDLRLFPKTRHAEKSIALPVESVSHPATALSDYQPTSPPPRLS